MNGKMSRNEIQKVILEEITEIGAYLGLDKTKIINDNNITSIYIIGKNALEIEIDWHNNSLFMYIVRLINKKLPNNDTIYTYEDGSWCRKYIDDIYNKKNPMYQSSDRTKPWFLLEIIAYYKNLIISSPNVLHSYLF